MHYAQDDEGAKDDESEHVDVIAVICKNYVINLQ
jgi:hypothetical protein